MTKKRGSKARPEKAVSPNGITIITKENHSTPTVSFCAYSPGGVRMETEKNHGISHLMQRLLLKGTLSRKADDIAKELEFLGSRMTPFVGKCYVGCSMTVLSKHFDRGLSIFADCLLNPAFVEEEMEKERRSILVEIEERKDDIISYCLEMADSLLFRAHPYRLSLQGEARSLQRINRDDLQCWHQNFYVPERMVLALVGDIKSDEATRKLMAAFNEFQGEGHRLLKSPTKKITLREPRVRVEKRKRRQVAVTVGFLAPGMAEQESFAFDVINYILSGMGSRLFVNLRDRLGLAYLVNSSYEPMPEVGAFKIYMGTSMERLQDARKALLREIKALRDISVGEEELERTKRYILGMHEISLQKNISQASRYAYYEMMGLGFSWVDLYPERIRMTTSRQVRNAAREYLNPRENVWALIIPR